jgi:hypothetical protein
MVNSLLLALDTYYEGIRHASIFPKIKPIPLLHTPPHPSTLFFQYIMASQIPGKIDPPIPDSD